jgi:hypothetical protein
MHRKYRLAVLLFFAGLTFSLAGVAQSQAASFHPGMPWLDTSGAHINAHGGGIIEQNGIYYWFGEKRTRGASDGVSVYSSRDLYVWQNLGLALAVDDAHGDSDIARGCVIERPKVLFNKKTNKYVLWFHLELKGQGYGAARAAVAVSDTIAGPYRFVKSFRPNDNMSRDMTVYQDEDGRAYIIYAARDNYDMRLAQLTDDYQSVTEHDVMIFSEHREAPAIFKNKGTYYLITSACPGWAPNQARLHVANSIFGPWKDAGDPMRGPNSESTFGGQSTFILPVPGHDGHFLFMADRWIPRDVGSSTHLWLPIRFENGSPVIEWMDSWNLGYYDQSGLDTAAMKPAGSGSRTLSLFANPAEMRQATLSSATAALTSVSGAKHRALKVEFETADQPRVEFAVKATEQDFRPFGALEVEVGNPTDTPARFNVEVEDSSGAKHSGRTAVPLAPHTTASYALPLDAPSPLQMGMHGEPAIPGKHLLIGDHKPISLSRVKIVRIFLSKPKKPQTLIFGEVALIPGVSYEKIVDEFGQSARENWAGKVKTPEDIKAQQAQETMDLKSQPALADRDEFGGWASGPKLEATGYFRVAKQDGKWWFVTPSGHLFLSMGFDAITTDEQTVVEGREQMFESLPKTGDPLAVHFGESRRGAPIGLDVQSISGRTFNFYAANLQRKYGDDWRVQWRATTIARLKSWGFNTIGNWSTPELYLSKQMPYTATLGINGDIPELSSGSDYWRRMYDVFDPRFEQAVSASVEKGATHRDDPWCLGYFVDNELAWGNMSTDRLRYGIALSVLAQRGDSAAKHAFVDRLKEHYVTIDKWNTAWKTGLASWDDLYARPYPVRGDDFTPQMKEDLSAFMREFAGRYFKAVREAVRKADPNHLYLGARFAGHTLEEVQACAEYCDVISFNIYRPTIGDMHELDGIDRPAIIGEFHMGALDRGMFHPGLVATANQAERAAMYEGYVHSVIDHPLFVGAHFFKYIDEPLVGRPGDGENYNIGFINVTDGTYPEMVKAARETNAEMYARRLKANVPGAPVVAAQ